MLLPPWARLPGLFSVIDRDRAGTPLCLPLWGRWPSAARSDEVVSSACRMDPLSLALREPAVSIADGCAVCPETLVSSFSLLLSRCAAPGLPRHPCAGANAAPAPAQGVSPLEPFPLARSRGVVFCIKRRPHRRREVAVRAQKGIIFRMNQACQLCAGVMNQVLM